MTNDTKPFRLGVVPFLNALPLYHTLRNDPEFEIFERTPADLTELVESRSVDAALLPIYEYFRGIGDGLLPEVSISSDGRVKSVLLFLKKPFQEIRSIAADRGSRTSVALLKVLLTERFAIAPNISDRKPEIETMLASFDAALVIGDAALRAQRQGGYTAALDLGEIWSEWTHLPFVYATWTVRQGLDVAQLDALRIRLTDARDAGMKCLDSIAEEHEGRGDLTRQEIIDYLTQNILTSFTGRFQKGAEEFGRLCVKHGLIPAFRPLKFYNAVQKQSE